MDVFLVVLGFVLVLAGIAGSFLPILPGPLTGWFGLLVLYLTRWLEMDYYILVPTLVLALLILVIDYLMPALGAKKFGGSKKGATGATLGLLIGLISPIPFGMILGAFVGAFVGELIHDHQDFQRAIRSAWGSFLAFLGSTAIKFMVSLFFFGIYLYLFVDRVPL